MHPLMTDKEAITYLKKDLLLKEEITELNSWIKENIFFYSNPDNEVDGNGEVLEFIQYLKSK